MNPTLNAAIGWLERGVTPIPALPRDKRPAVDWRVWQNQRPSQRIVESWFKDPELNIGVINGGPSHFCDIDFDDPSSYNTWLAECLKRDDIWHDIALKSYRVWASRGPHIPLYTRNLEKSRKLRSKHIDIRSQGNFTIVAPSIHPSGKPYRAIGNPEQIYSVDSLEEIFPVEAPIVLAKKIPQPEEQIIDVFDARWHQMSIQEIKRSVHIVRFVAEFTHVKSTSPDGNWWMAKCFAPGHEDHHPSFRIDVRHHCASCLKCGCMLQDDHGLDVIDLYMRLCNCNIQQAVIDLRKLYLHG